ncbi:MAG: SulP family sulfate permease [Verrucomicrobiales bacterium]|jgi:SulP family sulfate permease
MSKSAPLQPRAVSLRERLDDNGWLAQPRVNLISGLVVALALIPEAISFSIIAGVDPKVGLYASFSIAILISFTGGRPGMISAATGAMALVIVSLVADYGIGHLFAATILAGVLQVALGYLGVGELMRFVPRTVMIGFVNALAILIFLAQVPHMFLTEGDRTLSQLQLNLLFVGLGLAIIYGLPRITKAVPSPLVAIVVLAGVAIGMDLDLRTVGDMGELPDTLPWIALPDVPFTLETFQVILPYSITLAMVGLLESLLTAQLLDDMTDTDSDKNLESRGQGVANIATGFLGGMAGCAMIGQSMINHKSGGRTRLSTLASGVFLIILVIGLGGWVAKIPMAALVAVMIMVAFGTFDWSSVKPSMLKSMPRTETTVMAATVLVVVLTHNLAYGVGVGVMLSAIFFARNVSRIVRVTSVLDPDNTERLFAVSGELFFASTNTLAHAFDYDSVKVNRVEIDLSNARIWDSSSVVALDAVVAKFAERGIEAHLVGLNKHAERLHKRTTGVGAGH